MTMDLYTKVYVSDERAAVNGLVLGDSGQHEAGSGTLTTQAPMETSISA